MSAIITNQFRRNSRKLFLEDVSEANPSSKYFIGIGKSDPWPTVNNVSEDDFGYNVQLPSNSMLDSSDALKNLIGLLKVQGTFAVIPRNEWETGRVYKVYDATDINVFNIDSTAGHYPAYVTSNDNVYVCLSNNNGNSGSTYQPAFDPSSDNNLIAPKTQVDGYTWAYVCSLSTISDFYTDQFVDIPLDNGDDAGTLSVATGGLLYGFKVIDGGSNLTGNENILIRGNKSNGEEVQMFLSNPLAGDFTVTFDGGAITSITPAVNNSVWITNLKQASAEVEGKDAHIIPLIAPIDGFGAAPQDDLPSFYGGLFASYVGSVAGEIPANLTFRQISLVKDPDVTVQDSTLNVIDTLKHISVANTTGLPITKGTIIEGANGAKAFLDYIEGVNVYYHQNSSPDINQRAFNASGGVSFTAPDGTTGSTEIDGTYDAEYVDNSGEVLFLENRKPITRNENQQEDVKLVIQF